MKKQLTLSLALATVLCAAESDAVLPTVEMDPISIKAEKIENVSTEEVKSADVAEALDNKFASIQIVRRSGIANDIILRGMKKDNIAVLVDGTKTCGACPNRMDPPTSHVLTNNIESVEVITGPYDVKNFGALTGGVYIETNKPTKEFKGEVDLGAGSWNYRKVAAKASGGTDKFRVVLSASKEKSDQYEDGDGNDFAEQIVAYNAPAGNRYQSEYEDMEAYDKKTFMGKVYVDITDDQELMLSYTGNRSDNILYPSSPMDAIYDDSDIFNAKYSIKKLSDFSKELKLQYYRSEVDHPMSNMYRISELDNPMTPAPNDPNEMTHALTTQVDGVKVENLLDLTDDTELSVGIDGSVRNWEGHYIRNGVTHMHPTSIDDVDTKNVALFAEVKQKMDKTETKVGLRYDRTSVETANTLSSMYAYTPQQSNDYNSLGAYIFSKYDTTKSTSVFGGIGAASRVPDARELYFVNTGGAMQGNDTLKQTKNYQADLGFENKTEDYSLKTSVFYSVLKDYIYYNDDLATNNFVNLDATRYGLEIEGEYFTTDDTSLEFKAAYQRAQKDEALAGQTDRDLAETPPLKVTTSFIWEYAQKSKASATLIAADRWKHYDSDNGEQAISGYGIVNLKANYLFSKYLDLTVGVNNVGDATYAKTNTYSDMKLITLPGTDVILMNEPGRYYYVNAKIKF